MPTHRVHDFDPFLFQFSESFGVRYYGLAYLAGFLAAAYLLYLYWQKGRSPFALDAITDLMTYIVVGVLVGGRLGYFFLYQGASLRADPLALFRVWEGGMASHGGFIGVMVALWLWARKRRMQFVRIGDIIATTVPAGLLFGRIANFINGELYGKVTTVSWAWIFPQSAPAGTPITEIAPRHPSQLYQAGLEGLCLLLYMQWRFWKSDVTRTYPGQLSGEFLLAYAIVRAIGEVFREPDASLLFGLSRGTFYSIFLVAGGLWLIFRARRGGPARAA